MLLEEVRRRLVIQQFWFAGDSWDVCGPTYIKCNGWHWLLPCKGTRGDFQPVLALGLGLVLALDVIPSLFVKHEHTSLEWTRFMRFGFCMHAVARCRCFRRWMWCSLRHAHTNVLLQNVCVCWLLCQPKNVAKKIHHTYEKHNETHLRSFTLKSVGKNVFYMLVSSKFKFKVTTVGDGPGPCRTCSALVAITARSKGVQMASNGGCNPLIFGRSVSVMVADALAWVCPNLGARWNSSPTLATAST